MTPGAVILCGGESRRMGRPKAWLPFGPEYLLQRVVRLAGVAASPVVVVGAPGQDLPDLPADIQVVRDSVSGRGPLQGLAAGFAALPGTVELVFATATDVPFLEPRWIARLAERIGNADLVIPRVGGYLQPLAALYRKRTMLPAIESLLAGSRLRVRELVDAARAIVLDEDDLRDVDPSFGSVRNLNEPADYDCALRDAGFLGPMTADSHDRDRLA
ncbi:MAG: molybdenum cofactor guanylyltransferase [Isosphaeraceae bacterium]